MAHTPPSGTSPSPVTTSGATARHGSPSTGELISELTSQITRLVRDETRLAQAELTQKAKRLGIGAGLFGGAGLFAFFGTASLVTAAILAIALALPGWAAALIVAGALFAVAGVLALVGAGDVKKGTPPVPTEAIASTKADIATVKESVRR